MIWKLRMHVHTCYIYKNSDIDCGRMLLGFVDLISQVEALCNP